MSLICSRLRAIVVYDMYLRVADPRQVTFLCSAKENVTKRKAAPDCATSLDQPLALGPALLPRGILPRVAAACIPACGPVGLLPKAGAGRALHTGTNTKHTHLAVLLSYAAKLLVRTL